MRFRKLFSYLTDKTIANKDSYSLRPYKRWTETLINTKVTFYKQRQSKFGYNGSLESFIPLVQGFLPAGLDRQRP